MTQKSTGGGKSRETFIVLAGKPQSAQTRREIKKGTVTKK
jgi:hypothetical protein